MKRASLIHSIFKSFIHSIEFVATFLVNLLQFAQQLTDSAKEEDRESEWERGEELLSWQ